MVKGNLLRFVDEADTARPRRTFANFCTWEECKTLLEHTGHAVYESEDLDTLRDAVYSDIVAGNIDHETVMTILGRKE